MANNNIAIAQINLRVGDVKGNTLSLKIFCGQNIRAMLT
jgi:hypothetical protein